MQRIAGFISRSICIKTCIYIKIPYTNETIARNQNANLKRERQRQGQTVSGKIHFFACSKDNLARQFFVLNDIIQGLFYLRLQME